MTTATVARPPARPAASQRRRLLTRPVVLRLASLALVLGLWQAFGGQYSTSFPLDIARALPHAVWHDVLPALGDTLKGFAAGYGIAVVFGIPIGLAMSQSRIVELALEPYVSALYATPRLALIPPMILVFGIGFNLRFAVTIVSGIFPIIVNAYVGGKEVDRNLLDAGRAFTAGPFQRLRTIVVPGSAPYLFAGLRLGMARAFIGIIVAEIETSILGIGNLINKDVEMLRFDEMWVAIVVLGVFSILFSVAVKSLDRWTTMPWLRGRRLASWRARLWPSRA